MLRILIIAVFLVIIVFSQINAECCCSGNAVRCCGADAETDCKNTNETGSAAQRCQELITTEKSVNQDSSYFKDEVDTAQQKSNTVQLLGKIEIGDDSAVYLITKWTSRSKKTYLVTGTNSGEVAKYKDKIISADCVLKELKSWSGTIEILNFKAVNCDGSQD